MMGINHRGMGFRGDVRIKGQGSLLVAIFFEEVAMRKKSGVTLPSGSRALQARLALLGCLG